MKAARLITRALGVAAVGVAILLVEIVVDPMRACFAYLFAWSFAMSVCVGALLLLMTGHAAKADWMIVTRRSTEAIVDALPVLILLFVPVLIEAPHVYPWAGPLDLLDPAARTAVEHRHGYLNLPFFIVRSLAYLAIFVVFGGLLRAWSIANDARPRPQHVLRMRRLSGAGLPIVGLTLTWAWMDWTMSLDPTWASTIYGLYVFAGSYVAAVALTCILTALVRPVLGAAVPFRGGHAQAAGRVLLAMICFWAYMAFSQLLIYWIAGIPDEVSYYGRRTNGAWTVFTYLLVFGHFVAPFFALLSRHWKRSPRFVSAVSAWMLLMHVADVYWLVMPARDPGGPPAHAWLDVGAVLFVGGLACAWVLRRWATTAPLPQNVPELVEGLRYEASL